MTGVMPLIQQRYRVLESREATGIMGSSLGALISLFAYSAMPIDSDSWAP